MTAVPPPVPPEIVEKAAKAHYLDCFLTVPEGDPWASEPEDVRDGNRDSVRPVLAAVYGDIVEAARRDALIEAAEAIQSDAHKVEGMRRAARIVAGLRDSDADSRPTVAPGSVRQGESGSTPTRDGDGPQKGVQGDE